MEEAPRYWFKAKRYGWGWGLPTAWQGWVVYAVALALFAAIAIAFPPPRDIPRFILGVVAVAAALVVVCLVKGEPPRWRWGGKG